ncbi:MAG: hypothetical protein PVG45_03250 [Gammaproteobacteria bacterium]|jgi:hypothetical protein
MNAHQFRDRMAATDNALDLDAHMNLISKDISVFGVPDFDVIGYDDRFNQRKHEFDNILLKQVGCKGLNVPAKAPNRIMFKSIETVEGSDGSVITSGIGFIIQKEEEAGWRVNQQRVLPDDEPENDMGRGAL